MSDKKIVGYQDLPVKSINENQFGTESYVNSLSSFIINCNTPITIAIQGDWGTGKTSMMNMVKQEIENDVCSIWFNTWQYSQFSLGDSLPFLLISKLIKDLQDKKLDADKKARLINKMKLVAGVAIRIGTGVATKGAVDLTEVEKLFDNDENNVIDAIDTLKNEFETAVRSKLAAEGKDRVVIFVDDLDRIEPEKAIEILEILKIFLDCENCVFVLAVDYSVVTQGVKAKYGDTMDEEKGKSFFDKIIQLPFKMPVAQYKINSYLETLMKRIWGNNITEDEKSDVESYRTIIENTIGKNPRSIKRVVNSFTVIDEVAKAESTYSDGNKTLNRCIQKLLFALLCIQLSYEELFNYLIENSSKIEDDKVDKYITKLRTDAEFEALLAQIYPEKEIVQGTPLFTQIDTTIEKYCDWVEELAKAASKNNNIDSQESVDAIINVLQFSTMTSNSDSTVVRTKRREMTTKERSEYFNMINNNQKLSWFIDVLEELQATGYRYEVFYRKSASNYIRIFDNNDKTICDFIARPRVGWEIEFMTNKPTELCEHLRKNGIENNTHSYSYSFTIQQVASKDNFEKVYNLVNQY